MEIIGYIASILIGVALGLIGGGGSILTVPVLVYLFKIDAVLEMRIEKIDKLIIRYMKEGFSQPTSTVLELSDQDIKNVQHELLKRNPNISLN